MPSFTGLLYWNLAMVRHASGNGRIRFTQMSRQTSVSRLTIVAWNRTICNEIPYRSHQKVHAREKALGVDLCTILMCIYGHKQCIFKALHILFCEHINWSQFLLFKQGVFRDLIEKVVNEVGGSIWELEQGFALA